jgi:ABC-type multidrug transport system ATPase subunit
MISRHQALNGRKESMHRLYFLIGASGAGKTSAMKVLTKRRPDIIFRHFDSIGAAPVEDMVKKSVSGAAADDHSVGQANQI